MCRQNQRMLHDTRTDFQIKQIWKMFSHFTLTLTMESDWAWHRMKTMDMDNDKNIWRQVNSSKGYRDDEIQWYMEECQK